MTGVMSLNPESIHGRDWLNTDKSCSPPLSSDG